MLIGEIRVYLFLNANALLPIREAKYAVIFTLPFV